MKVALVGVGYWGSKLLRNLVRSPSLRRRDIVAVDTLDRLGTAYDDWPGITLALSLEEALADDAVRAVVIATPVETHAALAEAALSAGRHVLVEKPLAASMSDALALARSADERGLTLMAGHTFLFSPRVRAIATHLASGATGRIQYVTSARLNLGLYRDVNVIWDLAPHDFSVLFHLLDESPSFVQSTVKSVVSPGCPDVAFISLTFPSGTIASVMVSWLAPKKVRNTVLVGERQMIVYDDTYAEEPVKIYDKGVVRTDAATFAANQLTYRYGDTVAPYVPVDEPLAVELEHFLACIADGSRPVSDGWFGCEVVAALEAADRSWRNGGLPEPVEPAELDLTDGSALTGRAATRSPEP